ncbi:MAG TPA: pyridoxal-phosphate dependent enzyme [Acidimicrobiales bacterium]|nr:pyridoxal-phosphate dependent enzyme [Acidimicrobiales bacterium]
MHQTVPHGLGPAGRQVRAPTASEIASAAAVVRAHLAPTPVLAVRLPGIERDVLVKLEAAQPTGSFKVRGALAALAAYATADPATRVVTASAGNHALGIAHAAERLGVAATVVVSTKASPAKVRALARADVELVQHGESYEEAERHALALAEGGATFVSPYNDAHVMAGQATMVAEVIDQVGDHVTLVVPVGGGGLIAGSALGAAGHPRLRLVGVESTASPSVSSAVAAGAIVTVPTEPSLADGLGGNLEAGSVTPAVAGGRVHAFAQVDEDAIAEAVRVLVTSAGLVAEGAAAVGFAALMAGAVPVAGRPVVVLTGRNIAPAVLARLLDPNGSATP